MVGDSFSTGPQQRLPSSNLKPIVPGHVKNTFADVGLHVILLLQTSIAYMHSVSTTLKKGIPCMPIAIYHTHVSVVFPKTDTSFVEALCGILELRVDFLTSNFSWPGKFLIVGTGPIHVEYWCGQAWMSRQALDTTPMIQFSEPTSSSHGCIRVNLQQQQQHSQAYKRPFVDHR